MRDKINLHACLTQNDQKISLKKGHIACINWSYERMIPLRNATATLHPLDQPDKRDNVKMKKVRRNVFLTTSKWIRCKNVENVSLRAWKDYSAGNVEEYQSEKYSKTKY